MWFTLSLLAVSMLVMRRSAEKSIAGKISSLGMAWLQQAVSLPFIIVSLFFARFYLPAELSANFWMWMVAYVALVSLDIFCYFKAISLADISFVIPLMTLSAVGNVIGAYFILDQVPTFYGLAGALLIVLGAMITYSAKIKHIDTKHTNKLAALLILLLVIERSFNANIEVFMLRESNPTTFNFYSSLLAVPFILLVTQALILTNHNGRFKGYWKELKLQVSSRKLLLAFIGITNTINMLASYQAKLISPNAGYIGAVKSASVLPMVIVGVIFFKEKLRMLQIVGLGLILAGLSLLALN
jgi:drug/metabolite transporter (DMT)-like permease